MKTFIAACAALAVATIAAPAFAGMGVNGIGTNGIGTNGVTSGAQAFVPSAILLPTGARISLR